VIGNKFLNVNRGIVVDRHMRASAPGIYAAGDVAEAWDLLRRRNAVIAIAPLAYEQGMVAGRNMAGGSHEYGGGVSMNSIEVMGFPIMSMGVASDPGGDASEETFRNGDIYRKLVFRGNTLIGAILAGDVDHGGVLTQLIRSQTDITPIRNTLIERVLRRGDLVSVLPVVGAPAPA